MNLMAAGLLSLALAFMFLSHRDPNKIAPIQTAVDIVASGLQFVVDYPVARYREVESYLVKQSDLLAENQSLREALQAQQLTNQEMVGLKQQNLRLLELYSATTLPGFRYQLARIIRASDTRGRHIVTINRGSRDSVFEKQVVLGARGAIFGQVLSVTPISAKVVQLTDFKHVIPVRNQRTGAKAMAVGSGSTGMIELDSIENNSDVRPNDLYVSSGLDQLFPADFSVARVKPNGVNYLHGRDFASIQAFPVVNFDDTREVILLWRQQIEERPSETSDVETQVESPTSSSGTIE